MSGALLTLPRPVRRYWHLWATCCDALRTFGQDGEVPGRLRSGGDSVLKARLLLGTVIALDRFIWNPKGEKFSLFTYRHIINLN